MTEPLLMAHELSVQKGVRTLLSNVSLSVSQGDIWQLAGGNGVGKSTFLNVLTQIQSIDSGKVVIGETIRYGYFTQDDRCEFAKSQDSRR